MCPWRLHGLGARRCGREGEVIEHGTKGTERRRGRRESSREEETARKRGEGGNRVRGSRKRRRRGDGEGRGGVEGVVEDGGGMRGQDHLDKRHRLVLRHELVPVLDPSLHLLLPAFLLALIVHGSRSPSWRTRNRAERGEACLGQERRRSLWLYE
eukprot:747246-Hanusia_phi.AAC.1